MAAGLENGIGKGFAGALGAGAPVEGRTSPSGGAPGGKPAGAEEAGTAAESPREVRLSQEKLDGLIDRAFARGLKKGAKDAAARPGPRGVPSAGGGSAVGQGLERAHSDAPFGNSGAGAPGNARAQRAVAGQAGRTASAAAKPGGPAQGPGGAAQGPGDVLGEPGNRARGPGDAPQDSGGGARALGGDSQEPGGAARESGDALQEPDGEAQAPGETAPCPGDAAEGPDDGAARDTGARAPGDPSQKPGGAAREAGDAVTEPGGAASGEVAGEGGAEGKLAQAKARLLAACVRGAAPGLGLTPRGAEAALRLCDFAPCEGDDGLPDEAAVADALRGFLAGWPEFAAAAPPPPFASGTGTAPVAADEFRQRLGI